MITLIYQWPMSCCLAVEVGGSALPLHGDPKLVLDRIVAYTKRHFSHCRTGMDVASDGSPYVSLHGLSRPEWKRVFAFCEGQGWVIADA